MHLAKTLFVHADAMPKIQTWTTVTELHLHAARLFVIRPNLSVIMAILYFKQNVSQIVRRDIIGRNIH